MIPSSEDCVRCSRVIRSSRSAIPWWLDLSRRVSRVRSSRHLIFGYEAGVNPKSIYFTGGLFEVSYIAQIRIPSVPSNALSSLRQGVPLTQAFAIIVLVCVLVKAIQ